MSGTEEFDGAGSPDAFVVARGSNDSRGNGSGRGQGAVHAPRRLAGGDDRARERQQIDVRQRGAYEPCRVGRINSATEDVREIFSKLWERTAQ
jgi:hypothetical protein